MCVFEGYIEGGTSLKPLDQNCALISIGPSKLNPGLSVQYLAKSSLRFFPNEYREHIDDPESI